MARVVWSEAARRDLREVRAFHARSSNAYAYAIARNLTEAVGRLDAFPRMGRQVPEIESETFREVIVQPYRVIYMVSGDGDAVDIDILAIVHGRQDLRDALARRS